MKSLKIISKRISESEVDREINYLKDQGYTIYYHRTLTDKNKNLKLLIFYR